MRMGFRFIFLNNYNKTSFITYTWRMNEMIYYSALNCVMTLYLNDVCSRTYDEACVVALQSHLKVRKKYTSCPRYWNVLVLVNTGTFLVYQYLPENVIFMSFRTCWCYSEAYNTGMQKWFSIGQYSCTSTGNVLVLFRSLQYWNAKMV